MQKNNRVALFLIFFLFFACNRSARGYNIYKVINAKNGWLSDSNYQFSFFSKWDTERYYPLGSPKVEGKIPKSSFELRKEAKAGIISQLNNAFYVKMKDMIQDKVTENVSDLIISEMIFKNFKKVKIKKKIIEQAYSVDHYAYLLVQYHYPQLRNLINQTIIDIKELVISEIEDNEKMLLINETNKNNLKSKGKER